MFFGWVGEGLKQSEVHRNLLGQGSPANGACEFATQSGKGLRKVLPETRKISREEKKMIFKSIAELWRSGPAQFLQNGDTRNAAQPRVQAPFAVSIHEAMQFRASFV